MFTGIIEEVGAVKKVSSSGGGTLLRISCSFALSLRIDESVSVNGVCLTVVSLGETWFEALAVEETLRKSNLGSLAESGRVNLERAMPATGRLDGHIVQGHVDTVGVIVAVTTLDDSMEFVIRFDKDHGKLLIPKGSVTLDGISLTVAELESETLKVAIIPHTLQKTIVDTWEKGRSVNIEFDMIGKYVVGYMARIGR